jgi:hypothetical protein
VREGFLWRSIHEEESSDREAFGEPSQAGAEAGRAGDGLGLSKYAREVKAYREVETAPADPFSMLFLHMVR